MVVQWASENCTLFLKCSFWGQQRFLKTPFQGQPIFTEELASLVLTHRFLD